MNKKSRLSKKKLSNKGVTLIEVLVATLILAILIGPVLSALVATTRINAKTRERQETTSMGQDIMEQLKAEHLASIYEAAQTAVSGGTDFNFGGMSIPAEKLTIAQDIDENNNQFVNEYDIAYTDYEGFDVTITAVRDLTYGADSYGFSEFNTGSISAAQSFKYRIDVVMTKTGETEPFAEFEGTKLERLFIEYPEEETETT